MAQQLLVDLYGCDPDALNDAERVASVARDIVHRVGSSIVEELVHQFDPIGVTYIAVITTSHISIHTWPEFGYVALDVFSCAEDVPEAIVMAAVRAFGASERRVRSAERTVGRTPNAL